MKTIDDLRNIARERAFNELDAIKNRSDENDANSSKTYRISNIIIIVGILGFIASLVVNYISEKTRESKAESMMFSAWEQPVELHRTYDSETRQHNPYFRLSSKEGNYEWNVNFDELDGRNCLDIDVRPSYLDDNKFKEGIRKFCFTPERLSAIKNRESRNDLPMEKTCVNRGSIGCYFSYDIEIP